MVFSTVIIIGLAIQIPGDRRHRLGRGRSPRFAGAVAVSLAQQVNFKRFCGRDWNISDLCQNHNNLSFKSFKKTVFRFAGIERNFEFLDQV